MRPPRLVPVTRIRAIDLSTKAVTTLAGSNSGFSDATGGSAKFHYPQAITITPDGTTLVIGDRFNAKIRALDLSNNAVTTVGGPGMPPHPDLSPPLTQLSPNSPPDLSCTPHLPHPTSHPSQASARAGPRTAAATTDRAPATTFTYTTPSWPSRPTRARAYCAGLDPSPKLVLALLPVARTHPEVAASTPPLCSLLMSAGNDMFVVRKVT